MSQVLKAGIIYFGLVFGVGFLLGTVRVLWLAPHVGERSAELIEVPIMCLVTIGAARWVARHEVKPTSLRLLGIGCVALGLLLAAEVVMVTLVRRVTLPEYVASRDPVSGVAFLFMLGLFAIMPVIVGRSSTDVHKGAR